MKSTKPKPTPVVGELGDRFDAIIAPSGLAARKPKPKVIGAGARVVVVGGLIGALMFGSGRDSQQVIVASHQIEAGSGIEAGVRYPPGSNVGVRVGVGSFGRAAAMSLNAD